MEQYVRQQLESNGMKKVEALVVKVLTEGMWNLKMFEKPDNEPRLVADLKEPFIYYDKKRKPKRKLAAYAPEDFEDVHDAARAIASVLLTKESTGSAAMDTSDDTTGKLMDMSLVVQRVVVLAYILTCSAQQQMLYL